MSRLRFGLSSSSPQLRSPASERPGSHEWPPSREAPGGSPSPARSARPARREPSAPPPALGELDALAERLGRQVSGLREHVGLVVRPLESKLSSVAGRQPLIEWQISEFGGSLRALQDELKLRTQRWDAAEVQLQRWRRQVEGDLRARHAELQRELGTAGLLERRLEELEGRLPPRAPGGGRPAAAAAALGPARGPGAGSPCPGLGPGPAAARPPEAPELAELAGALRREIDASAARAAEQLARATEAQRRDLEDVARHIAQVEHAAGELFIDITRLHQDFAAWKVSASTADLGILQEAEQFEAQPSEEDADGGPIIQNATASVLLDPELTRVAESYGPRLEKLEQRAVDCDSSVAVLREQELETATTCRSLVAELAAVRRRVDSLAGSAGGAAGSARGAGAGAAAAGPPAEGGWACALPGDAATGWLRADVWGLLLLAAQDRLWHVVGSLATELRSEVAKLWRGVAELADIGGGGAAAVSTCKLSIVGESGASPGSPQAAVPGSPPLRAHCSRLPAADGTSCEGNVDTECQAGLLGCMVEQMEQELALRGGAGAPAAVRPGSAGACLARAEAEADKIDAALPRRADSPAAALSSARTGRDTDGRTWSPADAVREHDQATWRQDQELPRGAPRPAPSTPGTQLDSSPRPSLRSFGTCLDEASEDGRS